MNFAIFQIFNQIKPLPSSFKSSNSRSTREKGNSKTSLTDKMNARNSSPSTSRKREGNTENLGIVLKDQQMLRNFAVVSPSTGFSICKVNRSQTICLFFFYQLDQVIAFFLRIFLRKQTCFSLISSKNCFEERYSIFYYYLCPNPYFLFQCLVVFSQNTLFICKTNHPGKSIFI